MRDRGEEVKMMIMTDARRWAGQQSNSDRQSHPVLPSGLETDAVKCEAITQTHAYGSDARCHSCASCKTQKNMLDEPCVSYVEALMTLLRSTSVDSLRPL